MKDRLTIQLTGEGRAEFYETRRWMSEQMGSRSPGSMNITPQAVLRAAFAAVRHCQDEGVKFHFPDEWVDGRKRRWVTETDDAGRPVRIVQVVEDEVTE